MVWDRSKNCFMPPLSIQPWKPMLWRTLVTMPWRTLAMMKPMTRMRMAPMSAGSAPRWRRARPIVIALLLAFLLPYLWLLAFFTTVDCGRLLPTRPPRHHRSWDHGGDAGGRQDGAQALLRDLVLDVARHLGQRDAEGSIKLAPTMAPIASTITATSGRAPARMPCLKPRAAGEASAT